MRTNLSKEYQEPFHLANSGRGQIKKKTIRKVFICKRTENTTEFSGGPSKENKGRIGNRGEKIAKHPQTLLLS